MPNRTITVVIIAAVILAFGAAVIASSMGGDAASHSMPNGQQMDGEQMGR